MAEEVPPEGGSPGDTPTRHHQGLDLPVGATFLPGNRAAGAPNLLSHLISRLAWGFPSVPTPTPASATVSGSPLSDGQTNGGLASMFSSWIQRQQEQQQHRQQQNQQSLQQPQHPHGTVHAGQEGQGDHADLMGDRHAILHAPRPLPPIQLRPRPHAQFATTQRASVTAGSSTAVAALPNLMHLPSISTISDGDDTPVVWTNPQGAQHGAWAVHMALHTSEDAEHEPLLSAWQQPPPCLPGGESPRETTQGNRIAGQQNGADSPSRAWASHILTPRTPAEQLRQPPLLPPPHQGPRHFRHSHPSNASLRQPSPQHHHSSLHLNNHQVDEHDHGPSSDHSNQLQPHSTLESHPSDDMSSMTSYSSGSPLSPGPVHPWAVHPLVDVPAQVSTDRPPDGWAPPGAIHTAPSSGWTSNAAAVAGAWHVHSRSVETADQASQTMHRLATPSFPPSDSESNPESPGYLDSDTSPTTLAISQCLQDGDYDDIHITSDANMEDTMQHDDDPHRLPLPPTLSVTAGMTRRNMTMAGQAGLPPPPPMLSDALFEAALVTSATVQAADVGPAPMSTFDSGAVASDSLLGSGAAPSSDPPLEPDGQRSVFYWGYGALLRSQPGRLASSSGSIARPLGYCPAPAASQLRPLQVASADGSGATTSRTGLRSAAGPAAPVLPSWQRGSDSGSMSGVVGAGTRLPLAPRAQPMVGNSSTLSAGLRFASGSVTTTTSTITASNHATGRLRSTSAGGSAPHTGARGGTGVRSVGVVTAAAATAAAGQVRRWSANGGGPVVPRGLSSSGNSIPLTREAQQARMRTLLSTRHWTASDPPEGDPLSGMELPAWAQRFAPQPTTATDLPTAALPTSPTLTCITNAAQPVVTQSELLRASQAQDACSSGNVSPMTVSMAQDRRSGSVDVVCSVHVPTLAIATTDAMIASSTQEEDRCRTEGTSTSDSSTSLQRVSTSGMGVVHESISSHDYHQQQSTSFMMSSASHASDGATVLYSSCNASSVASSGALSTSWGEAMEAYTPSPASQQNTGIARTSTAAAVSAILSGTFVPNATGSLQSSVTAAAVAEEVATAVVEAAVAAVVGGQPDDSQLAQSLPWPPTPAAGGPTSVGHSGNHNRGLYGDGHVSDWDPYSLLPLPSLSLPAEGASAPQVTTAVTQTDDLGSLGSTVPNLGSIPGSALVSAGASRVGSFQRSPPLLSTSDLSWIGDGADSPAATSTTIANTNQGVVDACNNRQSQSLAEPPATTNLRLALERLSSRFNIPQDTLAPPPLMHPAPYVLDLPITSLAARAIPTPSTTNSFHATGPTGRRLSFMNCSRRNSQRGGQPENVVANLNTGAATALTMTSLGPASSPGRVTPSSTERTAGTDSADGTTPVMASPSRSRFSRGRGRRASLDSHVADLSTAVAMQSQEEVRGGPGLRDGRGELDMLAQHLSYACGTVDQSLEARSSAGDDNDRSVVGGARHPDLEPLPLPERHDSGISNSNTGSSSSSGGFLDAGIQTRQERRNAVCYAQGVPAGLAAQLGAMLNPEASRSTVATPTVTISPREQHTRDGALLFTPVVHQVLLEMKGWLDKQGVDPTSACVVRMATWLAGEYSWLQDEA